MHPRARTPLAPYFNAPMDVTATRPAARALDVFHPAVAAWFRRTFAAPTGAQALAWPHIKAGRLYCVKLYETPRNCAEYYGPDATF